MCAIVSMVLTSVNVKTMRTIAHIFVAFPEKLNFKTKVRSTLKCSVWGFLKLISLHFFSRDIQFTSQPQYCFSSYRLEFCFSSTYPWQSHYTGVSIIKRQVEQLGQSMGNDKLILLESKLYACLVSKKPLYSFHFDFLSEGVRIRRFHFH